MNLNENINSIKRLMGLSEQKIQPPQKQQNKSDWLGSGGQFERNQFKGFKDAEQYYNAIDKLPPSEIKRVRLIFPLQKDEKTWGLFLKLVKSLGLVTGIYDSLESAIKFVRGLTKKNVKVDEFVVGSHGTEDGGLLLMTKEIEKENDRYYFDNTFLDSFKPIIHPRTKVFFTACYGADFLDSLKVAAERIGVGVYGSAGTYFPGVNVSEKGFYYCSPNKFQLPTLRDNKPISFDDYVIYVRFTTPSNPKIEKLKVEQYRMTIKDGVFDKRVSQPLIFNVNEKDSQNGREIGINRRGGIYYYDLTLNYNTDLQEYFYYKDRSIRGEDHQNNRYSRKEKELGGRSAVSNYLKDMIIKNQIIVELLMGDNYTNIKSLPVVKIPKEPDNEFLLENKLCVKVDGSPISWFDRTIQ